MGICRRPDRLRRLCAALALAVAPALGGSSFAATTPGKSKIVPLAATSAAAFELRDMAGKLHRLEDYRGKVVLINFWATWCEPCRDEMPSMQALQRRVDAKRSSAFVVLAVNYAENEARVAQFLKLQPLDFPVLLDPFSEVWRSWKPGLLPASFLLGRDGRVRYRVLGEIDWTSAEAEKTVLRLLEESS